MAYDKQIASLTAACEASNQPPIVRRLIIHAMFNRTRVGAVRYGKTVSAVCLKRAQFSEWDGDAVDNRNLERVASMADSDPILLDCAAAYDEVAAGAADPTGGATHFFDTSIPAPYWTAQAVHCGTWGKTSFWKDVP